MTDVTLMLSSGSGPRECQWAAQKIAVVFCREAKTGGISALILESENPASTLLRLSGAGAGQFASVRCGTVQWIGQSPFRKNHKRKNWYIGVSRIPDLADIPDLNERDITYTATRASGPGGQHVNKTNSAVRAVHVPTGITVTSQEERSQHANKRLCRSKLAAIFAQRAVDEVSNAKSVQWAAHKSLERGNPVRIYVGERFRPK